MALTRGFARNAATTPLDARLADMAKIVANADGSPRVGVLSPNGAAIVSTTSATGPMTVTVAAAEFVTSKSKADGVFIFTNDGTASVPISAAPTSNSRITTIWVKHEDNTTGDTASLPIFGTTDGAAAANPTKAAIPTGALELATLRVYSGTTASNGGSNVLSNTFAMTALRGDAAPFRNRAEADAWTTAPEGQLMYLADRKWIGIRVGAAWQVAAGSVPFTEHTIPAASGLAANTWISLAESPPVNSNDVSWSSGTSSRLIANVRGRYRVASQAAFASAGDGRLRFIVNGDGNNPLGEAGGAVSGGIARVSTDSEIILNVGDYVEVQMLTSTSGATLNGGRTTMTYIGALTT